MFNVVPAYSLIHFVRAKKLYDQTWSSRQKR